MSSFLSPTSSSGEQKKINVLLIDDSAVIRGGLSRVLETDSDIEIVGSVHNGEVGVEQAGKTKPHIIILDIEMPVMDGLTALPKILEVSPESKVIMFSSLTEKGASVSLKALSLGAVECIAKPSAGQDSGVGSEFQRNLIHTIKGLAPPEIRAPANTAGAAPVPAATSAAPSSLSGPFSLRDDTHAYKGKPDLIAIGSSTGGPQALFEVLKNFTNFKIPIIITQHMPATFTKILAQHIEQHTGIPSFEGEEGMAVKPGQIYVAPGGKHMLLVRNGTDLTIKLDDGAPINFCKPSVDPMINSAVQIFGNKVLGLILTGMGNDGIGGGKTLTEAGGRLIAQDEATSVVWGMPGAVAKAGLCSKVLPLKEIGPWFKQVVL